MPRKNGGSGPRTVALVGPFASGKTTLLESILMLTGAVQRKGVVAQGNTVGDLLAVLQEASDKPLLMRQIPILDGGAITGFVDLALERAFVYREHAEPEVIELRGEVRDEEKQARYQMLEKLADFDEHLMEELLSDVEPLRDEVFDDLTKELAHGLLVPVLLGSSERDNGIHRLLKALRHEVPDVSA